jgi:hypothetical protein
MRIVVEETRVAGELSDQSIHLMHACASCNLYLVSMTHAHCSTDGPLMVLHHTNNLHPGVTSHFSNGMLMCSDAAIEGNCAICRSRYAFMS